MTDKKLTDEEIIKQLERCVKRANRNYNTDIVLDLINRQKAEITELESKIAFDEELLNKRVQDAVNSVDKANQRYIDRLEVMLKTAKPEAYKEFAERLKNEMRLDDDCDYNCRECYYECKDYVIPIDTLLKEMVGEEE